VILAVAYYQHLTGVKEGIINSSNLSLKRLLQNSGRIPFILYQLQRQIFGTTKHWNLLGFLFVISLIVSFRKAFSSFYFYILLAVILNFILYITVYILTPHELSYHMGTSQNRVLLHFIPLMLLESAVLLYSVFDL